MHYLVELMSNVLMGGKQTANYVALDVAFFDAMRKCGVFAQSEQDELFMIWVKAFDHQNRLSLTQNEILKLAAVVEAILKYRRLS